MIVDSRGLNYNQHIKLLTYKTFIININLFKDYNYKVFDGEEEQVRELEEDAVFECKGSKLEPIINFSSQWITERIDDDRFSENNSDNEYEKITKILDKNIDFKKITDLLPKLYYENHKDKFTITKQDLLDAL